MTQNVGQAWQLALRFYLLVQVLKQIKSAKSVAKAELLPRQFSVAHSLTHGSLASGRPGERGCDAANASPGLNSELGRQWLW